MAGRDKSQESNADRLRDVIARVPKPNAPDQGRAGAGLLRTPTRQSPERASIKFPNVAGALRTHVARVKAEAPAPAKVALRLPGKATRFLAAAAPTLATPARAFAGEAAAPILSIAIDAPPTLGRLVREARDRQRISQSDLASRAGTGRRFISELEAGKATVQLDHALRVCHALGLRLRATIGDE